MPHSFFDPDVGDVILTPDLLLTDLTGFGDPTKFLNGAGGLTNPGNVGASLTTVTKATNYTVLAGDTGTHFNNNGASVDLIMTLPSAVANLNYGFLVAAAHYVRISVQAGQHIAIDFQNSLAGGYVRSNAPFSFLLIECHFNGQWIASSMVGTWSVDS
jgi:hypothetical protein